MIFLLAIRFLDLIDLVEPCPSCLVLFLSWSDHMRFLSCRLKNCLRCRINSRDFHACSANVYSEERKRSDSSLKSGLFGFLSVIPPAVWTHVFTLAKRESARGNSISVAFGSCRKFQSLWLLGNSCAINWALLNKKPCLCFLIEQCLHCRLGYGKVYQRWKHRYGKSPWISFSAKLPLGSLL